MLEQYYIQYELNGCCLRAPWIMEKDDFKYQLSFGDDVFGGPRWRDLVGAEAADGYVAARRGAGDARPRRQAGEAQLRPRRRPGRGDPAGARQSGGAPADVQHLHGRTGRLRRAGRVPGVVARLPSRCRSRRRTTRRGSTTPRRSSCSAGARATTSRSWPTRRSTTGARPTTPARFGTRADVDPRSIVAGLARARTSSRAGALRAAARLLHRALRRGAALAGGGARAREPDRRTHRLQRRLRAAGRHRSSRRHRRRAVDAARDGRIRAYSAALDSSVDIPPGAALDPGEPAWANYLRGVVAGFARRGVVTARDGRGDRVGGAAGRRAVEQRGARGRDRHAARGGCRGTRWTRARRRGCAARPSTTSPACPCGLMDQLASVFGEESGALLIDCQFEVVRRGAVRRPGRGAADLQHQHAPRAVRRRLPAPPHRVHRGRARAGRRQPARRHARDGRSGARHLRSGRAPPRPPRDDRKRAHAGGRRPPREARVRRGRAR